MTCKLVPASWILLHKFEVFKLVLEDSVVVQAFFEFGHDVFKLASGD
jgi:hypothetical protein